LDLLNNNTHMRNQYKILAEKYEQVNDEGRKPGTPKVTPYTHADGTTAYKSLTKWGKRQDWRTSAAAHKAAGIPEPKQAEPEKVMKEASLKYADFSDDENFEYNGRYYSVEAIFDWENKATGHRASIGHHGVTGQDTYRDVPVGVNQLQVTDMETGNVVTDKEVLNAAAAFALTTAQENPDSYHQYEGTAVMEDTDHPFLFIPPEQKQSINRLFDMGYDFSQWIRAGHDWIKTGQIPQDKEIKTAVMVRKKRWAYSVVEVTPDGLCNGKPLGGTKQVREMMEPMVDDKPDAEDRVADGITAKLDMTDKSDDSVSQVLRAYWKELEAEWKQHHPTQRMPEDVKEELWHSIHKGMEQAGVDPTEY